MKKINLFLALLISASVVFAQKAVNSAETVQVPTDSLGIHPWDGHENDVHVVIPNQSHWSIFLGAGFNVSDVDFTNEQKHKVGAPTISLGGTYHWNNTWGVGAEYRFRNYQVVGSGKPEDADLLLKGMGHQLDMFVTFDIFNAFRPQNKYKFFALDVLAGGGMFCKKNSVYYPNVYQGQFKNDFWFNNVTAWQKEQNGGQAWSDDKYGFMGAFLVGLSAEFNINRSFQVGLRGTYSYMTTDDLVDGRRRSNNNDGFFDCEAILRYKFVPRDKSNVRNFMTDQQIANWNDGTYYEDPAMGAAKRAKYKKTPGGVPFRDTIVSISIIRDTVWMMPAPVPAPEPVVTVVEKTYRGIRDYVVFFENDDPELDNAALSIAGEAAMLLKSEPDYNAVVVGSCDNTGAVVYNQWLATERANNVTAALVGMGIDSSRIYMVGRGIMQDDRDEGSYRLNRRVEIQIVSNEGMAQKKDELSFFERYRNVKKGSAVRKSGEGKDASSSAALKAAIEKMKKGEDKPQTEAPKAQKDAAKKEAPKAAPKQEAPKAKEAPKAPEAPKAAPKQEAPKAKEAPKAPEAPKAAPTSTPAPVPAAPAPEKPAKAATPQEAPATYATTGEFEKIIVPQDATLAILAKQYYGDAKLWTVIFEANKDRMSSPDQLRAGAELIIPKLKK